MRVTELLAPPSVPPFLKVAACTYGLLTEPLSGLSFCPHSRLPFQIAVKEGNESSEAIKALVDVLKSDEITEFINGKYDGGVIPFK